MKKKILIVITTLALSITFCSCSLNNDDDSSDKVTNINSDTIDTNSKSIATSDNTNTSSNNDTEDSDDISSINTNDSSNLLDSNTNSTIPTNDSSDTNSDTSTNLIDNSTSTASTAIEDESSVTSKNCRLYYFNTDDLKLYYVDKTLTITDKAVVKALTSALQQPISTGNYLTLTSEVDITSASLDSTTGILSIHFNDDYTNYMTLGSATESGILQALVNTYGYNYGVDKVAIYFGDDFYYGLKGYDAETTYYNVNYGDCIAMS